MKKKIISLSKTQLNRLVKESIKKDNLDDNYYKKHQFEIDFGDDIDYREDDGRSEEQKKKDVILQSLMEMKNDINAMIKSVKNDKSNASDLAYKFSEKCRRYIEILKTL